MFQSANEGRPSISNDIDVGKGEEMQKSAIGAGSTGSEKRLAHPEFEIGKVRPFLLPQHVGSFIFPGFQDRRIIHQRIRVLDGGSIDP